MSIIHDISSKNDLIHATLKKIDSLELIQLESVKHDRSLLIIIIRDNRLIAFVIYSASFRLHLDSSDYYYFDICL